jgi:hypothetical protein
MKPRARRVTIAAAVLGVGVLGVLVVAHWSMVRDHVEAWHFQLATETEMLEPNPAWSEQLVAAKPGHLLVIDDLARCLSNCSGRSAIVDSQKWPVRAGSETVLQALRKRRWRVLEQRFPRRAYVVIRDKAPLTIDEPEKFGSGGR